MPTPHDALFHATFGQPENAADLLRGALPPALAAAIDWSTLVRCDTKLTDSAEDEIHADLLFKVKLAGRTVFLFVLLEHKSTDDPLTAYQLLRYVVRIWEWFRREHPGVTRLPPIIPFVLHHGDAEWRSARSLRAMIDLDGMPHDVADLLGEIQPELVFLLDDLAAQTEEQLGDRVTSMFAKLALLCMQVLRGAPSAAAAEALRRWSLLLAELHAAHGGQAAFLTILSYIVSITDLDRGQLRRIFAEIDPRAEATYMTTTGRIIKDAMAEGLAQGVAQGVAQGEARLLLRQLERRFGPLADAVVARINAAPPADLERWADRVLTAATLDAVLHD